MAARVAGNSVPGWGPIGPDHYNALITMHGTIMIFFVAMPFLLGGFGNFLIPLMVGADDMAFPRLNMTSFWTLFTASSLLVASMFVPGGPAAAGWTSYAPLSDNPIYTGVYVGPEPVDPRGGARVRVVPDGRGELPHDRAQHARAGHDAVADADAGLDGDSPRPWCSCSRSGRW